MLELIKVNINYLVLLIIIIPYIIIYLFLKKLRYFLQYILNNLLEIQMFLY